MRPLKTTHLVPSMFETVCVGLVALGLLILGNARLFLQRYDLINSSAIVRDQLSSKVGTGLHALDSFGVTASLVTFAIWAVVGIVMLSVILAIARTSRVLRYQREVGSNAYLHPQGFDRQQYWREMRIGIAVSFGLTALLGTYLVLYLLFVVPVSFSYVRQFLLQPSPGHAGALLLGIFTVFAGTLLLYTLAKLTMRQRQI